MADWGMEAVGWGLAAGWGSVVAVGWDLAGGGWGSEAGVGLG